MGTTILLDPLQPLREGRTMLLDIQQQQQQLKQHQEHKGGAMIELQKDVSSTLAARFCAAPPVGCQCPRNRLAGQRAGPHRYGTRPIHCGCCVGTCEVCDPSLDPRQLQ